MAGKRYVIGDIHGAYKALLECFEMTSFDMDNDMLVCLGDVCDGWPEVNKVFDKLLEIKNLIYIIGNHDKWALDWFLSHNAPSIWTMQGGRATIESYQGGKVPESHTRLLSQAHLYYHLEDMVFVHGGFDPGLPLEQQDEQVFLWDRDLVYAALQQHDENTQHNITGFSHVYVGHTPTINLGTTQPVKACEVIMMDTGAGWPGGVLTMMDIDTHEIVQSSHVNNLYPNDKGRGY
ncbi:MAG: metallophosphoesterase [Bacteroidales bacterium]|nr:metallophosphoesterase [Bacteroidales bacterium]MBN2763883.1 metallophosphoesterase [Bacteroidales bacterium]